MNLYTLLFASMSLSAIAQQKIDFKNPPNEPKLFAEGFISTSINERDFALSPDGTELFYTISTPQSSFQTIVWSKKDNAGNWSKPEVVSFAGTFSDLEPTLSADGNKLYFASNRPLQGSEPKDFDIWVVERRGRGWSGAKNLGPVINSATDEFYPSITKSGNLYFTATYPDGIGKEDIFMAAWRNDHFEKPVALDTAVNSKGYEFNAFVDPDEQFILFTGYGRKDDAGRGDLYMSVKDSKGKWVPAKNLKGLNSNRLDYCPYVSPDKKTLFFTSERASLPVTFTKPATANQIESFYNNPLNGTGNVYWISFDRVRNNGNQE